MSDTIGVPRGRLNLKCDSDSIELLTVQHRDVYEELRATGVALANVERSAYFADPMFAPAYRWMSRTLMERCDTHSGFDAQSGAMFWLWAGTTRRALVADAAAYGPGHVLLRCRIDRRRVLLTDFDAYHGAFYGDIVYSPSELARATVEEDFQTDLVAELNSKYSYGWYLADLAPCDRVRVQATWANMCVDHPGGSGTWTQACVSHLELSDVSAVYELTD